MRASGSTLTPTFSSSSSRPSALTFYLLSLDTHPYLYSFPSLPFLLQALRLDLLSAGSTPPGELTNLLAVDAESLLLLMVWSHMLTGG